jgi:acyl carrier protein
MLNDLTDLILQTAREIGVSQEMELPADFNPRTPLFGEGGALDSMALVSLVIAVEQAIEEKYGVVVELANDKALSQRNSPYRTVETLATFATQELQGKGVSA